MEDGFILKLLKGVVGVVKEIHEIYSWERNNYTPLYVPRRFYPGHNFGDRQVYSGLKNLEYRKIIENVDGKHRFTKKGKVWLKGSLLRHRRDLHLKWDNKWRIVMFDIPQELHNKRNQFRKRLKLMGFYKIQKSVFVFPYPCEKEIAEYCSRLGISDYINIINVNDLGYVDQEVKKIFNV